MSFLALLSVPVAVAADFDGTYTVTCNDLGLGLATSLVAEIYGTAFTIIDEERDVPMDCNGVAESDIATLEADVEAECDASGIGLFGVDCGDIGAIYRASIEDLNDELDGLVPSSVEFVHRRKVGTDHLFMGRHRYPDGSARYWGYLLHPEAPGQNSFQSDRLAMPDPEVDGIESYGFSCTTGSQGLIDGTGQKAGGAWSFDVWLESDFTADCDQGVSGGILILSMEQQFTADLSGSP